MKTKEQNKQLIVNYLTKTSNHIFINPKSTFKWGDVNRPGYYEYDYNDFTYLKVIIIDQDFYYLDSDRLIKIDIDNYINYYDDNAKCVISNRIFLNKKVRSIRSNKYNLEEVNIVINKLKPN